MLNHIVIMGRLTWDPELRYTQSQVPVASFRVAVDRDYSGRDGGEKQADFIDCVAWRSTAEFVSKYFSKGSMIVVSGHLQIRNWTDKENNRRTSAEVVAENVYFGESRRRDGEGYRGGNDNFRSNEGYRGGNDGGYRGGNDNRRSNDSYRGNSGNDSFRGGNSDGGYRGGNDSYSGGNDSFRSFDDSSAGSGFTELSDTDGELPF